MFVTSPPGRGAKRCDERMCMSVCTSVCLSVCYLSARIYKKPHVQISRNFLHVQPVTVAGFCSDVMLTYFRFFWMTLSQWARIKVNVMFRPVRQMAAPGDVTVYDCILISIVIFVFLTVVIFL